MGSERGTVGAARRDEHGGEGGENWGGDGEGWDLGTQATVTLGMALCTQAWRGFGSRVFAQDLTDS